MKEKDATISLQDRAREACSRYRADPRKPIVIEFAGVPKAGKSSTLSQLSTFLRRCGFSVKIVVERASVCPIKDKRHFTFNIWTGCTTLAQILEHTQDPPRPDDPDILLLDRGLFDAICWLTLMDRLSRITTSDREITERFLLLSEWRARLSGVVVMLTSPDEALKREQGCLPVEGTAGSIMNREVIQRMVDVTRECAERLERKFAIRLIDTSAGSNRTFEKTCMNVATSVLELIEAQLSEDILSISRSDVVAAFGSLTTITGEVADSLLRKCRDACTFRPREEVEQDVGRIQPLPVVVVRRKNGDVLQLRRREKSASDPLHEKLVVWAGGHVRKEDSVNGDCILRCARRELNEELRLSVEEHELAYLGAVYVDREGKTRQHLALVFEWRAQAEDVAVTLSTGEFFERRGTALSGTFVEPGQLAQDLTREGRSEPWSHEILRGLIPISTSRRSASLFE